MFGGIVAERNNCDHCTKLRMVASIPRGHDDEPYGVAYSEPVLQLCAGCIYKLTRLAALLLKLEAVPGRKAKRTPKKAQKARIGQPEPVTAHRDPTRYEGGSLVPPAVEVSP